MNDLPLNRVRLFSDCAALVRHDEVPGLVPPLH